MTAPRILSLGAGVQSTAIALMSIDGHLPPLDHAIFADTGWEPRAVSRCLMHDTLAADLRAAAAELRRLRDRDAALTRLLDAVGETSWLDWWTGSLADIPETLKERLRRIAAAVEGIDQEHER